MSGFDKNKSYWVTVSFPNGKIMADKHGEFEYLLLKYIWKNKNGVYIGWDDDNRERRFNARLIIHYSEA
jgi:hypothetical protein